MTFTAIVSFLAENDTVRDINAPAMNGFHVDLKAADGTGIDSRVGAELSYTFTGLPAGDYVVDAYSVDVNGAIVGTVATLPFTAAVPAPTTTNVKTVSAISVAVTPE